MIATGVTTQATCTDSDLSQLLSLISSQTDTPSGSSTPLSDSNICDTISPEALKTFVERLTDKMKQKEILSHYDIKQLPNNGRWYATVGGKRIKKTKKEDGFVK